MISRRTFIRSGSLFVPTLFYVGHGQQAALWRRKVPATTTLTLTKKDEQTSGTNSFNLGNISTTVYLCLRWITGSAYDLAEIDVHFGSNTGSPSYNVKVGVWSNNGATWRPDTQQGGWSDAIAGGSITQNSLNRFVFSGVKPSLSSGASYWIVVNSSTVDASNYCSVNRNGASYVDGQTTFVSSSDMASYNNATAIRIARYATWAYS